MGGAAARNLRRISMERGLVHEKLQSKQEEELPSFEELSRDLQGWNGRWKKKKASALIQERIRIDELEIEQRRLDIEERHKKAEERREQRRRTIEIEQHELQEEVNRHEARQKAQRLVTAWSKMARRVVDLHEQLIQQLQQPTECVACSGSGQCMRCHGEGSLTVTYLTPSVPEKRDEIFRGRCLYGCPACGGSRDGLEIHGRESSELGSGMCRICHGDGQIWPSMKEVLKKIQDGHVTLADVQPKGEIYVHGPTADVN